MEFASNLGFLIVFAATQIVKMVGLPNNTTFRNRVLPVIALVIALMTRFVIGVGGEMPDIGALAMHALGDTAMAMGLKGGVNWTKSLRA